MFHNLYICSCITCCLIVYNYLHYHALCGAFSEIKSFKFPVSIDIDMIATFDYLPCLQMKNNTSINSFYIHYSEQIHV